MKYRKKLVVIDAWRIVDLRYDFKPGWELVLPKAVREAYEKGRFIFTPNGIEISTLAGMMRGNNDDYLILGVHGEFYPCKPDIFAATYEEDE